MRPEFLSQLAAARLNPARALYDLPMRASFLFSEQRAADANVRSH